MNILCGQTQTFFGNQSGSREGPPSHHLSANVGPVIGSLLFILPGLVLKQYTVAATQNRNYFPPVKTGVQEIL